MNLKNLSIEPTHLKLGKTQCIIKYEAKSDSNGSGTITIRMAGADSVSFVNNSTKTKFIGPEAQNFKTLFTTFTKSVQIEVISKSSEMAPRARIEIAATDSMGAVSSLIKTLSHD